MALRPVKTTQTDVADLWRATEGETRQIRDASIGARGTLITVTWAGAGSQVINHKLRQTPTGWIVCDRDAAQQIHRTAWTTSTISLTAAGAVSAKILVF